MRFLRGSRRISGLFIVLELPGTVSMDLRSG